MAQQFYQAIKQSGILTDEQYRAVQAEQAKKRNCTFFKAMKNAKVMDEEKLVDIACQFFHLHRIENAFKCEVDFTLTNKTMGDVFQAMDSRMFVLRDNGKQFFVLNDPENESLRNKASSALGQEPEFALITSNEFNIILHYQLTPRAISEQANKIKVTSSSGLQEDQSEAATSTQKLLDMLINAALERRASDLHLLPLSDEKAQVMLRVDGALYNYAIIKADILQNLRNRLKTMSNVGGDTPDRPVEGQINTMFHGKRVDIRVNILKSSLGYDFNLRFIDANLRGLEELGLTEDNYNQYMHLLHMTKGLVILCGPTGSGKTSLMYAGFKRLLSENKAIFTIEDPVEIVLPGITQLQVYKERGMSYAERFPSALRHDPDVIGIGEIRTLEVAEQTIQAANTGHLVVSTVHTNDSIGAISRLKNLGLQPYTIGDVLAAVVAQRLVRRVCPYCAETYELPKEHIWRKRYNLGDGNVILKRGKGCEACAGTGYRERVAVHEFLVTTPELRSAIQKNATRTEIENILRENGFKTYIEDAREKAIQGITSFDEVDKLYADIL